MLKKIILSLSLFTALSIPFVGISAQNTTAEISNTIPPVEYNRTVSYNVDLAIYKDEWKKIGSDFFQFSVTTLDSLMTTVNGHKVAIVYYKLTLDNPYVISAIRERGMPTFNYIVDVHCFDLTDNSSIPFARFFIGDASEQLRMSTQFDNSYMSPTSKIAKKTRKYLIEAYNLEN